MLRVRKKYELIREIASLFRSDVNDDLLLADGLKSGERKSKNYVMTRLICEIPISSVKFDASGAN